MLLDLLRSIKWHAVYLQALQVMQSVQSKIKEWRTRSAKLLRDVEIANLTRQSLSNNLHQRIEELELLLDQCDLLEKSNQQLLSEIPDMVDKSIKVK